MSVGRQQHRVVLFAKVKEPGPDTEGVPLNPSFHCGFVQIIENVRWQLHVTHIGSIPLQRKDTVGLGGCGGGNEFHRFEGEIHIGQLAADGGHNLFAILIRFKSAAALRLEPVGSRFNSSKMVGAVRPGEGHRRHLPVGRVAGGQQLEQDTSQGFSLGTLHAAGNRRESHQLQFQFPLLSWL